MEQAVAFSETFDDEGEGGCCEIEPVGTAENSAGADKRGDRQAVPVGQELIVAGGWDAAGTDFEQLGPQRRQALLARR